MQEPIVPQQADSETREKVRLFYLDWLRVIGILGVFLIHVTVVFSEVDFHINNPERSSNLTTFSAFFYPWGMPLVFLIAGAGTWFALQKRPAGRFIRERSFRLLIPFFTGSILFSPMIFYFEWLHKTATGAWQGSYPDFIRSLAWFPNPRVFAAIGDHLWFLGFLFCFSLLTLPLFRWLNGTRGRQFIAWLARLCGSRGSVLIFILPLLVIRLGLQSTFPQYLNWTDFASFMMFYILGYLLFADDRFIHAIRRDWPFTLTVGIVSFLVATAISIFTDTFDTELVPHTVWDWAWWALFTCCTWGWTAFMLFVGMRFLNFSNKFLQYWQGALLPFFMVHMMVVVVIAYYVVQWNAGILPKLLVVLLCAFAVSLGLYHFIIRRIGPLRVLFGIKA